MPPRSLFLSALAAIATIPTAPAAEGPGKETDSWLVVPSRLVSTRAVRAIGAPAHDYRCILVVPPATNLRSAKPRMLTSTGVPALDSLAWEFVSEKIAQSPALKALLATKELEFKLQITPPSLEKSDYKDHAEQYPPPSTDAGYWTPKPVYPFMAQATRAQGAGAVRVTFSNVTGRPIEVIMEQSTGSQLLDSNSIQWAAFQWRWLKPGTGNNVRTVPIKYTLEGQTASRIR